MEIKQHSPEQQMGQRRNQKENLKKTWDKGKWKCKIPKVMGCCKSSSKKQTVIKSLQEKKTGNKSLQQPNLHLKELEKQEQIPRVVGRK